MKVNNLCRGIWVSVLLVSSQWVVAQQSPTSQVDPPDRPAIDRIGPTGDYSLINDMEEFPVSALDFKRTEFAADTEFVSPASRTVAMYQPKVESRTAESMAAAAKKFLDLLPEELASKAVHKLDSRERSQWTNLPARANAGGVRMDELNQDQLQAVLDLLATMLSDHGYEKLRLIMLGDDELIRGRRPGGGIGTDAFAIVIFGEPHPNQLWAIQFDGHHIGLNIAVKGQQMTLGPSFLGAQPFEFKLGGKTLRPMEAEQVLAFKIVQSLTEDQFRKALVGERRGQLRAGPGRDGMIPEAVGIDCSEFNEQQQQWLLELIVEWVGWLPKDRAWPRLQQIKNELDKMKFSWNGPRKTGSDVSYTIQSPSLLIEFAYQDLGGVPPQHLHTQYRNLKNEYGTNFEK